MDADDREAKIRELTEAYEKRLRDAWPEGDVDITRIEELVERIGGASNQDLAEQWIREQARREGIQETACPSCAGRARYKGQYAQEVITAHGRVRVGRAYYHCAAHTTPTVQARTAALGAWVPYTRLPEVAQQIGVPWRLDVKSGERVTQRVGAAVRQNPPASPGATQRPVAVAVDGVYVLTRSAGWKEARCAVVYEPDAEAGRSPEACAGLRKEYLGGLVDRETVLERACQKAAARVLGGTVIAALGDGAHWIWDGYAQHLPHRVEILDFYHAWQHLARVAQALHPDDAEAAAAWLAEQRHELRHLGPWRLLRELAAWRPQGRGSRAARKVRDEEWGYFERNRERMHYPEYARRGFPIGTGAVEGACKHLVTTRFKQAGMRWGIETAEPLLHLRAALLSQPGLDLRGYAGAALTH